MDTTTSDGPTIHEITVKFDGKDLTCDPDKEDVWASAENPHRARWVAKEPVGNFVVFFDSGAPVEPRSFKRGQAKEVTVQPNAEGTRKDPDKKSKKRDTRPIKYCVAAIVNGELESCDPELIVQPGG